VHHVVGGLTCRAVVVDDDRRPTHEIADPRGDVGIQIQQVASRHHAHEIPTPAKMAAIPTSAPTPPPIVKSGALKRWSDRYGVGHVVRPLPRPGATRPRA